METKSQNGSFIAKPHTMQ
jgi:hypothetical protein